MGLMGVINMRLTWDYVLRRRRKCHVRAEIVLCRLDI